MPRKPLRQALAVLVALAVVLPLLWQLATAATGGNAKDSPASSEPSAGDSAGGAAPGALAGLVLKAASRVSLPLGGARLRPRPSAAAAAQGAAAPVQASLPPPSPEAEPRSGEGLPVSAMRCTREGGVLQCGDCRTDGDCPPGQGCVANRETRRFECMASECEVDVHCFPGFLCRAVTTGAAGAVVRRCVPEGIRRQGEPCDTLPLAPARSCGEGLRCVEQVCTQPCQPGAPQACPPGHSCSEGVDGAGCLPDCRQLGCPAEQRCAQVGPAEHRCLAQVVGDCNEQGCPEGERCNMRRSQGSAVFWCARRCQPLQPGSCPPGQVCGMGSATESTCYVRCDPVEPQACFEGWTCISVSEDMTLWGCRPDSSPPVPGGG